MAVKDRLHRSELAVPGINTRMLEKAPDAGADVVFLDLEDAALLYDKVMSLWHQYRAVLPLQVHTVRYERLIERFDETVGPLLDFMGVGWDDAVRDHVAAAHRRGRIRTTSYNQVAQPLYTRARGRWQRYRDQMAPVLPILLPWAQRFGYGNGNADRAPEAGDTGVAAA